MCVFIYIAAQKMLFVWVDASLALVFPHTWTAITVAQGGVVVCTIASQQESSWFESLWSLHVNPMHVWLLSRYSGFSPESKNMSVCMAVCLVCVCVGPVMDWWPVQGVPYLSLGMGSWPPPHELEFSEFSLFILLQSCCKHETGFL